MRRVVLGLLVGLLLSVVAAPATADEPEPGSPIPAPGAVTSTSPPVVSGTIRYGSVLTATPGSWDPADVTVAYRWFRDAVPIGGTKASTYLLKSADIGHRITVRVTASAPGRAAAEVFSRPTATIGRKVPKVRTKPSISGTRRYGKTLTADPGRWSVPGLRFTYRWQRDGRAIPGATRKTYALQPADVGRRVAVRVVASGKHIRGTGASSARTGAIKHRRDVRRTVTYRVVGNGNTGSLSAFRELAAKTLGDPRGWRGGGIRFKRVGSGGAFTLVLAKASRLPSYSSVCSTTYSCRVGRNVIINESRWRGATKPWNAAGGSLRGYRHMVVNHEVGHFLGKGHAGCGGKGKKAPVMMQQSKGLGGCAFNPWPTSGELGSL